MSLKVQESHEGEGRRGGGTTTTKKIEKDTKNQFATRAIWQKPALRIPNWSHQEVPLPSPQQRSLSPPSLQTRWIRQALGEKALCRPPLSPACPTIFPLLVWRPRQRTNCWRRGKQLGRGRPSFLACGCPANMISIITICSSSTRMKTWARGEC